jgi:hypothetical protein
MQSLSIKISGGFSAGQCGGGDPTHRSNLHKPPARKLLRKKFQERKRFKEDRDLPKEGK